MTIAKVYYGTAFQNGTAVILARVVGEYSEVLKRKELQSGTYSAFLVDPVFPDRSVPVEGHQNVALDLDSVFFNALQTDSSWDVDSEGFNFRHVPDISTHPLFAQSGRLYLLDYAFTLKDAGRMIVRIQFRILTR